MAISFAHGNGSQLINDHDGSGNFIVDNIQGSQTGKFILQDLRGSYADDGGGLPNWSDTVYSSVGAWSPVANGYEYLTEFNRGFYANPTTAERCYGASTLAVDIITWYTQFLVVEVKLSYDPSGATPTPDVGDYAVIQATTSATDALYITKDDLIDKGPVGDDWYYGKKVYVWNRYPVAAKPALLCEADSVVDIDYDDGPWTEFDARFYFNYHYCGHFRMTPGTI